MKRNLKILLYRFLYRGVYVYWKIFGPKQESAVCIVEHNGSILLARNSYGDRKWIFPGGGCKRGERIEIAAQREVSEEVGIEIRTPENFGTYRFSSVNRNAIVHCFYAKIDDPRFTVDGSEILEAAWFKWSDLPAELSTDTIGIIELYTSSVEREIA